MVEAWDSLSLADPLYSAPLWLHARCKPPLAVRPANVRSAADHVYVRCATWRCKRLRSLLAPLFVSDVKRGSGSIQGEHLQLPFHRNRRGQIALGLVASLILQLSHNREGLPVLSKRCSKLHTGTHFYILADPEGPVENGYPLFDHRQIERLGLRVHRRLQFHFWHRVDYQLD